MQSEANREIPGLGRAAGRGDEIPLRRPATLPAVRPAPPAAAQPPPGQREGRSAPRPGHPSRIRVLVADDSALVRQVVRRVLDADAGIEVVGTASDGFDALLKVERLQPDVVTMDVEMPRLDGLAALRLLMERFPRPVVMLSSRTDVGTTATVRALTLGAVDYLAKPSGDGGAISSIAEDLIAKIKRASVARVRRWTSPHPTPAALPGPTPIGRLGQPHAGRLLVIGASTGGPRALAELLANVPAGLPCAAIVVQHLPAGFTKSLAERLDQDCPLAVSEARDGEPLVAGRVLVAPGDFHLRVVGGEIRLDQEPRRHGVRPSVDVTLESAATVFGPALLAVVLTGMGGDGAQGAVAVRKAGGSVLAEAESSCVVFGMPRAVIEAGAASEVAPLERLPSAIARHLARLVTRAVGGSQHA